MNSVSFNHHGLSPSLGEPRAEDARVRVSAAAGGNRHDNAHGLDRPALRVCLAGDRKRGRKRRSEYHYFPPVGIMPG
jgi:hypothetical protein